MGRTHDGRPVLAEVPLPMDVTVFSSILEALSTTYPDLTVADMVEIDRGAEGRAQLIVAPPNHERTSRIRVPDEVADACRDLIVTHPHVRELEAATFSGASLEWVPAWLDDPDDDAQYAGVWRAVLIALEVLDAATSPGSHDARQRLAATRRGLLAALREPANV